LREADVAVIQTEWEEYRTMDPLMLQRLMARPCVVDARRALDPHAMRGAGVAYWGVGYPPMY